MQSRMTKRLSKEYELIQKNYKDQFTVNLPNQGLDLWHIKFTAAKGTIYQEEVYTFDKDYPIESPEVVFVGAVPTHEHIYSNGFICLSILYDALFFKEWSAALTVQSVCMSILSMLSSAKRKIKPYNDKEFCKRSKGRGPKSFAWFHFQNYQFNMNRSYDDDTV